MVTELAPGVEPPLTERDRHGKYAAFPRILEDEISALPRQSDRPGHIGDLTLRERARRRFVELYARHPDHRVSGDHRSQFVLAQLPSAGRTFGQDQVTSFGAAVPDENLDRRIEFQT